MQPSPFRSDTWLSASDDAQAKTVSLAQQTQRTLSLARTLVATGRRVELVGLDRSVGFLCAKALDLPPEQGRALRAELITLLAELDSLTLEMRADPA